MKLTSAIGKAPIWSIFFILIMLASVSAVSQTNYTQIGYPDRTFNNDMRGYFNPSAPSPIYNNIAVSSPDRIPLSGDLDGNSSNGNEMIIVSGSSLAYLRGASLTAITSVAYKSPINSNIIIHDLDNDGVQELIYGSTSHIIIYNISQTSITYERNISMSGLRARQWIGCSNDDVCMIASVSAGVFKIGGFNSTANASKLWTLTSASDIDYCFPNVKSMGIADYDNDGVTEFIISDYKLNENSGQSEIVEIRYYSVSPTNNNATLEQTYSKSLGAISPDSSNTCNTWGNGDYGTIYMTSPLMVDILPLQTGTEAILGYNKDDNEFKAVVVLSDTTEHAVYPSIADADGTILGNPFVADAFPETTGTYDDACVIGHKGEDVNTLDVLCFSPAISENKQYKYITTYNISTTDDVYSMIGHSSQMTATVKGGRDLDEIVTSYGVFELLWNEDLVCDLTGDCQLGLLWSNPKGLSATYPIDFSGNNRTDIVMLTATNLWLARDGLTNIDCNNQNCITSYEINPCIDSAIKINETMDIEMVVTDENGELDNDQVTARACVYVGTTNEHCSAWQTNATSGTTFTLQGFQMNKSINGGTIRLYAKETGDYSITETTDLLFTVGINGVTYGSCTTSSTATATSTSTGVADTTYGNNSVQQGVNWVSEQTNLGGGIVYLLMLLAIIVVLFIEGSHAGDMSNGKAGMFFGFLAIVFFGGLWLGYGLGFVNIGLIIAIAFISMAIVSIFFWNKVSGGG